MHYSARHCSLSRVFLPRLDAAIKRKPSLHAATQRQCFIASDDRALFYPFTQSLYYPSLAFQKNVSMKHTICDNLNLCRRASHSAVPKLSDTGIYSQDDLSCNLGDNETPRLLPKFYK